jgi:hypothetical protein
MLRHWLLCFCMTTRHEAPFGMRRNLPTDGDRTVGVDSSTVKTINVKRHLLSE